jgi:hypothetical protein
MVTTDQQSVVLFVAFLVLGFVVPSPFAAADDEWINGDQQGELFEASAEFSHCRRSSFRHRVPA